MPLTAEGDFVELFTDDNCEGEIEKHYNALTGLIKTFF